MSTYDTEQSAGRSAATGDVKERAVDTVAEVDAGAKYVAGVAGEEAGSVAHDVKRAARGFFDETRTQLSEQASTQQRRAAGALRSTGDELEGLASGTASGAGGAATSAVRTIGQQTRRAADWLEQREPADVVREVRGFARRHTGAFLVIALGVGIVAGRLTRALVSDARSDSGMPNGSAGRVGARPMVAGNGTVGAPAGTAGTTGWNDTGVAADGDTPIGDALAGDQESMPTTPGSQGLSPADDTAQNEWSPSGEARR
jgi:hypothetical protein